MVSNTERNIELNFPIQKVKEDIDRAVKIGSYTMHSKNDLLNTYRIGRITGLESISMNVTLKPLENGNTNIHIVVQERIRNSGHQNTIDRMIDAFLERLSKSLIGANDEEIKTVSSGNKGCLVLFIFLITATISSISLISCNKDEKGSNNSSCGYYTFSDNTTTPVYKGSGNGCYYINSNGNKTYVDGKYCCP